MSVLYACKCHYDDVGDAMIAWFLSVSMSEILLALSSTMDKMRWMMSKGTKYLMDLNTGGEM